MKQGDIYSVNLNPVKGSEQAGERPVLVVSSSEYNRVTNLPVCAAITQGGDYARVRGFTVSLSGLGLKTQGVVRLDQIRGLDLKARGGNRVESIPAEVLADIVDRVCAIFDSQ